MATVRMPLLSTAAHNRLHLVLWLLCVVTYVGVLASNLMAGGTDLVGMAKAMASTLAVAVLGRLLLTILSQATREVRVPSDDDDESLGSLVDLVSTDESPAPLDPDGSPNLDEYGLPRG